MRKQRVLFLTKKTPREGGSYHCDIIRAFQESHNVFLYGPGFDYYDRNASIDGIIEMATFFPDIIVIGTVSINYQINYRGFKAINIPKIIFLNKEYQGLKHKLAFIVKNNIALVSTVLNRITHLMWEESTGIPFVHIPFAADYDRFKPLGLKREYDFGFCGSLFKKHGMTSRKAVKDYIFNKTDISKRYKILWRDDECSNDFLYGNDYVEALNKCKVFLSMKSMAGIIGQRFYELSGTKTLIMCPEDNYDGIFKDNVNCVMYKNDLSDFGEKLDFCIDNPEKKDSITDKAYKIVRENHTWQNRLEKLFDKWEEIC